MGRGTVMFDLSVLVALTIVACNANNDPAGDDIADNGSDGMNDIALPDTAVVDGDEPDESSDELLDDQSDPADQVVQSDADDILPDETGDEIADTDAAVEILTGKLVGGGGDWPGPIAGVSYVAGAQSGITGADGSFSYEAGGDILFSVGTIEFGQTPGASLVSPWQLVGTGVCHYSDDVARAVVLLFSLDDDGDPSTGVTIASIDVTGVSESFADLTNDDIAARIAAWIPGRVPLDETLAVTTFVRQMDSEQWAERSVTSWSGLTAAKRAQGVATDGQNWYFSWQYGLDKTDMSYGDVMANNLAIPPLLQAAGSNHIGDIDFWNGTLYAPVEDGSAYKNPKIVLYDNELNSGTIYDLSNTLLTAGVPWVAVDGPAGTLYVAEWDPTPGIYVYDLATVTYQRTVPLYPALGRIQGAKIFEGAMYANSDVTEKTTVKIDLETGANQPVSVLTEAGELEGLAFLPLPDGTVMHTLNVTTDRTGTDFRHHERTRDPLRKQICP